MSRKPHPRPRSKSHSHPPHRPTRKTKPTKNIPLPPSTIILSFIILITLVILLIVSTYQLLPPLTPHFYSLIPRFEISPIQTIQIKLKAESLALFTWHLFISTWKATTSLFQKLSAAIDRREQEQVIVGSESHERKSPGVGRKKPPKTRRKKKAASLHTDTSNTENTKRNSKREGDMVAVRESELNKGMKEKRKGRSGGNTEEPALSVVISVKGDRKCEITW